MKQPAEISQQIEKLKQHGIIVDDYIYAVNLLQSVNYYRLRGYWLTFNLNDASKPVFIKNIADVYNFDTELKAILWRMIEPIEIKIRTQFAYHLSTITKNALAHKDTNLFKNENQFNKAMSSINAEIKRAKRNKVSFVAHNINKYSDLPIWAVVELISFGCLSKLCGNLKTEYLNPISKEFGINNHYFKSWSRHLGEVRNVCAHHNRLYNRSMILPAKLFKEDKQYISQKQFPTFIVLSKLYRNFKQNEYSGAVSQLEKLFKQYPSVSLEPIGFPENWQEVLKNS